MRHSPSTILLLLLTGAVSAATFKCTAASAVDFSKGLVQSGATPENLETYLEGWRKNLDLKFWELVDEVDGKKGGVGKRSGDFECKECLLDRSRVCKYMRGL